MYIILLYILCALVCTNLMDTVYIVLNHISTAQPFIRVSPGIVTVNQTNIARLVCTAQGNPLPNITWTGPSTDFTTSVSFGSNFTVTSTLTISSANRSQHEGGYTCTAENGVGPVVAEDNFASGNLIVQGQFVLSKYL